MKYLPAMNIWAGDQLERLISGDLVLQIGQWIRCGENARCSRWCGVTSTGTLVAAHPRGKRGVSMDNFRNNLDYHRRWAA